MDAATILIEALGLQEKFDQSSTKELNAAVEKTGSNGVPGSTSNAQGPIHGPIVDILFMSQVALNEVE